MRRQALFDFMYETYDASAWIPQSLFDTNAVTHAIVGDVDTIVGDKVGLVLWRDNPTSAGVRDGAERGARRAAQMDGELPGLPHGGDRRARLLRCGDEDVRRAVARRRVETADERALARPAGRAA